MMNVTIRKASKAFLLMAATCLTAPLWAASIPGGYSSVVVFGDSLSDTGRGNDLVEGLTGGAVSFPDDPYYEGRFSNGPNYVDNLQSMWGLTPGETLHNFAFGGASVTEQGDLIADLGQQSWEYTNSDVSDASTALGVMNIGSNDMIAAAYASGGNAFSGAVGTAGDETDIAQVIAARSEARIAGRQAANAVMLNIAYLGQTGLSSFLLFNLADVGDAPRFADPNAVGTNPLTGESTGKYASLATEAFNRRLARNADLLRLLGFEIYEVDVAARAEEISADPSIAGLTDGSSSCSVFQGNSPLGLPMYDFSDSTCDETDPDSISVAFWDDVHPTAALHLDYAELADQALGALGPSLIAAPTPVPLPAPLLLLAGGLVALAGLRRV